MKISKLTSLFLAGIVSASLALAPTVVSAKKRFDNPNSGTCKSGTKVANIKNCKENGGKK